MRFAVRRIGERLCEANELDNSLRLLMYQRIMYALYNVADNPSLN